MAYINITVPSYIITKEDGTMYVTTEDMEALFPVYSTVGVQDSAVYDGVSGAVKQHLICVVTFSCVGSIFY